MGQLVRTDCLRRWLASLLLMQILPSFWGRFFSIGPSTHQLNDIVFRNFIPRVPLSALAKEHGESFVVFIAPGLKLANPGRHCLKANGYVDPHIIYVATSAEYGLQGNNFTLVDFAENKIFIGGTRSLVALQQAIAALSTYKLAHKRVLPLSADSMLDAAGKPVLLLGPSLQFSRVKHLLHPCSPQSYLIFFGENRMTSLAIPLICGLHWVYPNSSMAHWCLTTQTPNVPEGMFTACK